MEPEGEDRHDPSSGYEARLSALLDSHGDDDSESAFAGNLLSVVAACKERPDRFDAKMRFFSRLLVLLRRSRPNTHKPAIFGSTISSFALDDSDLDIVLLEGQTVTRDKAAAQLSALQEVIEKWCVRKLGFLPEVRRLWQKNFE